jgi:hypothetical protein
MCPGATGCDAQPVAVWVYEGSLASGKSIPIDKDAELFRHAIDVLA